MVRKFTLMCGFLWLCVLVQPPVLGGEYDKMLEFLQAEARKITDSAFQGIGSLADWETRRPGVRRKLLYMLGLDPLPPRTPLNLRVTGRHERPGFTVENIVFESLPGLYVTANLYLPADLEGKAPAILYVCGHSKGKFGVKTVYQYHGEWFARHGYICLVMDTIWWGEIRGAHHGAYYYRRYDWYSRGYTPAGVEVWNGMRAVDLLSSRPDVDTTRIGITGISGGGAMSWFGGAVDERIDVVVPVLGTGTIANYIADRSIDENCDCIYPVNQFRLSLVEMFGLIAPRPLLILNADQDIYFPPAGYREFVHIMRKLYRLYGKPGNLADWEEHGPHRYTSALRLKAFNWFERWFKDSARVIKQEEKIEELPPDSLRCFAAGEPEDEVISRIHEDFIPLFRTPEVNSLADWERFRESFLENLRRYSLGPDPEKVDLDILDEPAREDEEWSEVPISFVSEANFRLQGRVLVPKASRPPYPAIIYLLSGDALVDSLARGNLERLVESGYLVLLVENRGALDPGGFRDPGWHIVRSLALLGRSPCALGAWDARRAVDYLVTRRDIDPGNITCWGSGRAGVAGLYAALFDDRFRQVIMFDPPPSHFLGPVLLNVLKYGDIPQAMASLAPRRLLIAGWYYPGFDLVRRVYGLYGKPGRFRTEVKRVITPYHLR